jgi:hypothetical protein
VSDGGAGRAEGFVADLLPQLIEAVVHRWKGTTGAHYRTGKAEAFRTMIETYPLDSGNSLGVADGL